MGSGNTKQLPGVINSAYVSSIRHETSFVPQIERIAPQNETSGDDGTSSTDDSSSDWTTVDQLASLLKNEGACSHKHFVSVYAESINKHYTYLQNRARERIILGQGMHGSVFKIKRASDSRCFAFKTVRFVKTSSSLVAELKNELEILGSIDHPRIAKLFEIYLSSPREVGLILELGNGGDLYERLADSCHFPESDVIHLMKQMLDCVKYLHGKSIVHRDLKLENWVFTYKQKLELKLIDFGLGIRMSSEEKLRDTVGTTYYIAPEVLKHHYDERCDLWSLGVICFMMLTGRPPFTGDSDKKTYAAILQGSLPTSDEYWWEGIQTEARDFISRLLTLDPGSRATTTECFKHSWLKREGPKSNIVVDESDIEIFAKRVVDFSKFTDLKRIGLQLIASDMDCHVEVQAAYPMFSFLNNEFTGKITKDRLEHVLKSALPLQDYGEVFDKMDSQKRGYLEWSEILAVYVDPSLLIHQDMPNSITQRIFSRVTFSKDGEARIKPSHLAEFMGPNMSRELATQLILEANPFAENGLTYSQFNEVLLA